MNNIFTTLAILLILSSFTGCRKNKSSYMSETAVITGVDPAMCPCCGGLMINFNNNPKPRAEEFSLIGKLPDNTDINKNSTFPVYVKVSWEKSNMCGSQEIIDITKIERR